MDRSQGPPPAVVASRMGSMLGVALVALGAVVALGAGDPPAGFRTVVAGTLVLCLFHAVAGYLLWRGERRAT